MGGFLDPTLCRRLARASSNREPAELKYRRHGSFNGRIAAAQKEGKNLKIVWDGSLYDFDSWAIPKGSPNKDAAYRFIAFASKPENQKVYSQNISYGPSNKKALSLLDRAERPELPTAPQNMKNAVKVDLEFWADHGESLEQRFNAWALR
ncbi:extracellular solute-binding protein [Chromobacterium haemolyticum]|uniref:Extracellular solute-binding protein n=1 Tax=Chromobacterium fluminis TaxID=3044269 RepID=A0ABX0L1Y9_9NEIS|nr:extracellular solute-binding protein [Chromobacterium haemolyticum]